MPRFEHISSRVPSHFINAAPANYVALVPLPVAGFDPGALCCGGFGDGDVVTGDVVTGDVDAEGSGAAATLI